MSDGLRMTAERIDEATKRCEAATPGPWINEDGYIYDVDGDWLYETWSALPDDDAFIAAARTDLPDLLHDLALLRAVADAAAAEHLARVAYAATMQPGGHCHGEETALMLAEQATDAALRAAGLLETPATE